MISGISQQTSKEKKDINKYKWLQCKFHSKRINYEKHSPIRLSVIHLWLLKKDMAKKLYKKYVSFDAKRQKSKYSWSIMDSYNKVWTHLQWK